jgi:ferrous iron transport protein B
MIKACFVGNPNCGKTTLFNTYTGANLKVANWPGVTVEKKEGTFRCSEGIFTLVDLPGIYSLNSYTMEEKLTRNYIINSNLDIIINIVDASHLERNLYLTLSLLELGKPMVIALNMIDIAEDKGISIDLNRLQNELGVPVIPVSAKKKTGLDHLIKTAAIYRNKPVKKFPDEKYNYIDKLVNMTIINKQSSSTITDRIDGILTHRYLGFPLFLGIMALIFVLTFVVGGFIKQGFEYLLAQFIEGTRFFLKSVQAGEFITSLLVEGIISGVGVILTFIPNIVVLYFALAFLEDSGYMARVAYVMDPIMGRLGLSGRAFIPMLLGFGCTVPAVLASRTLENMSDRRKTILITPFMSCSARLPVYVLFSQMFFKENAVWVAFSMYIIGIVTAVLVAFIIKDRNHSGNILLIELPDYKMPNQRTVTIYVYEKVKEYLTKAGTTIFAAAVIMWFILNFNSHGMVKDMSLSFGASIGKALAPLLVPAGLGLWQVVLALISGIAAKEVVVSSFSVLFSVGNITSAQGMTTLADILRQYGFGTLNAYSLMVFCLLYIPCAATIGVIQREMRSVKWTLFTIIFQLGMAMLISTLIYQIGYRMM